MRAVVSIINERTNEIHNFWFMLCPGVPFQENMLHEYNYLNLYQINISKTMQSAAKTIILIIMLLL
jgi:tellurite resistance protein TehA-like permease